MEKRKKSFKIGNRYIIWHIQIFKINTNVIFKLDGIVLPKKEKETLVNNCYRKVASSSTPRLVARLG